MRFPGAQAASIRGTSGSAGANRGGARDLSARAPADSDSRHVAARTPDAAPPGQTPRSGRVAAHGAGSRDSSRRQDQAGFSGTRAGFGHSTFGGRRSVVLREWSSEALERGHGAGKEAESGQGNTQVGST